MNASKAWEVAPEPLGCRANELPQNGAVVHRPTVAIKADRPPPTAQLTVTSPGYHPVVVDLAATGTIAWRFDSGRCVAAPAREPDNPRSQLRFQPRPPLFGR